jgi:hypothetical protein
LWHPLKLPNGAKEITPSLPKNDSFHFLVTWRHRGVDQEL